jgi:hypothetical protein
MKRWLFLALVVVACSSKHSADDDDDGGSGGESAGSGGTADGGKGGASGSGASSAKGGSGASSGRGGSSGKGGSDLGGAQALGGDTSVGGDVTIGNGGAGDTGMPNGGEPAAEGGTGGSNGGTGGSTSGTGGSLGGGAGQSSASCDASLTIASDGFVQMPAHDACWHGSAFSGGDTAPATSVYPETWDTCGASCQLAIIGTVAGGTGTTYAYLGFYLNQAAGGTTKATVTPKGTALKITYTYTSALTARIQLSAGSKSYCAALPESGTSVPYTSFNTACWNGSGSVYAKDPIDSLEVMIVGAGSPADFNLHITNVEEI